MARLVERPKAGQELEDIAVHIARDRPSAARRFLAAAQKTYVNLAAMPEMGAVWPAENPRFQGLRYFPISRYPNYVNFYGPLADGGLRSSTSFTAAGTYNPSLNGMTPQQGTSRLGRPLQKSASALCAGCAPTPQIVVSIRNTLARTGIRPATT
jgi:toxin ParE1/3/4